MCPWVRAREKPLRFLWSQSRGEALGLHPSCWTGHRSGWERADATAEDGGGVPPAGDQMETGDISEDDTMEPGIRGARGISWDISPEQRQRKMGKHIQLSPTDTAVHVLAVWPHLVLPSTPGSSYGGWENNEIDSLSLKCLGKITKMAAACIWTWSEHIFDISQQGLESKQNVDIEEIHLFLPTRVQVM